LKKIFVLLLVFVSFFSYSYNEKFLSLTNVDPNECEKSKVVFLNDSIYKKTNSTSTVYFTQNTILSGINYITAKEIKYNLSANKALPIINLDQLYVESNTIISIYSFELDNPFKMAFDSFHAPKKVPKARFKQGQNNKISQKTKQNLTCFPYNQTFNGFYNRILNTLAILIFQNKPTYKNALVSIKGSCTPHSLFHCSTKSATISRKNILKCNNHFCKHSFSLPPPSFLV